MNSRGRVFGSGEWVYNGMRGGRGRGLVVGDWTMY